MKASPSIRDVILLGLVRFSDTAMKGLWSVVGGAVLAPSKDLWETRPGRFPWVRHDPWAGLARAIVFMPSPSARAACLGRASWAPSA